MEEQETLSALRVENARLIALLEVHCIDWRQSVPRTPHQAKVRLNLQNSESMRKLPFFAHYFVVDPMLLLMSPLSTTSIGKSLGKAQLPQSLANRLIRLAAFQNPEFYKSQAMRLPVWNKPRAICYGEKSVARKTFRTISRCLVVAWMRSMHCCTITIFKD